MSSEAQRVVVIEDSSRDVSLSAIKLATQGLSLKPGDKIIVLRVLHQVTNPSTLSLKAGKLLGHKVRVDPASMFGASQKMIDEEISRKREEYVNNKQINEILQQWELAKIDYHIEVKAAPSLKLVALETAKSIQATWVILDRKMKKDEKFLMGRLTCRISRVKRNNVIEELRGPKKPANIRIGRKSAERRKSSGQVKYDEMIPGSTEEELTPRKSQNGKLKGRIDDSDHSLNMCGKSTITKSSLSEQFVTTTGPAPSNAEASSSCYTDSKYSPVHFQSEETTERETTWEHSPNFMNKHETELANTIYESPENIEIQHSNGDRIEISHTNEVFRNSICFICRNRRPKIGWKRDFTYAELQAATEGFNPRNFLSEGGFGSVYRGEINGIKIAVKQHKNASSQGEKEFKSEVNVLSKARHENLVMLLGSCSEGNHRLLVYEYVCNGSLDQHLSKHSRRVLTWEKRMKIALGTAKGLRYLHGISIIHRDMRPNNILVTHDYEALLGDFGLAKTQYEDKEMSSETTLVGTLGYLAPEYAEYGKVSSKTDVYSFGVVLLQLITGLKTTDKKLGGKSLVGWARPLLKERNYPDLIDTRIVDTHDVHQLYWMVRVAEKCLTKDPKRRLSMDQVVGALNDIIEGRTVCCFREISPVLSDSPYSFGDSGESQVDNRSITLEPITMRNVGNESMKLPPSPSLQVISSGGLSMSSL